MLSPLLAPAMARRGVHYGWVVVAVAFLTMLGTAAAVSMPRRAMVRPSDVLVIEPRIGRR
jgi:hypothetical protein